MSPVTYRDRESHSFTRRAMLDRAATVAAPVRPWPHGLWPLTVFAVMAVAAIVVLL
jgi:hypothetical protein